jgi:hypothetical protein
VTEFHVVRNHFLSNLERQVTGDAVRFEMIFVADDEAQKGLEALGLFNAQVALFAPPRVAGLALMP